jgi:hypothetical protein
VTGALSRHATPSDPVQLVMDERDQSVECGLVTLSPLEQERGDVRVLFRNPAILGAFQRHWIFRLKAEATQIKGLARHRGFRLQAEENDRSTSARSANRVFCAATAAE